MRYFAISNGLRGCYMPDSIHIHAVKSRRELKSILADEARRFADDGYQGASIKAVAAFVAAAWRSTSYLDTVLPLQQAKGEGYSYGLFCSPSTKADWQAYQESDQ